MARVFKTCLLARLSFVVAVTLTALLTAGCAPAEEHTWMTIPSIAPADLAEALYEHFVAHLRHSGYHVETGVFGAMMDVALVNDGPVTFILDTEQVSS